MADRNHSTAVTFGIVSFALLGLAIASLAYGVFAGLLVLTESAKASAGITLLDVAMMVLLFLAGAVVAGVLWAVSVMVARQHRMGLLLGNMLADLDYLRHRAPLTDDRIVVAPHPPAAAPQPPAMDQVLAQLAELNMNVLLSEEQRQVKHRQQLARAVDQTGARVRQAISQDDFASAQAAVEELTRLGAEEALLATLQQEIAVQHLRVQQRDVQEYTRRCNDLMALASFDQAERAAEELLAKHPSSSDAAALTARVAREAKTFQDEHIKRMFAEVEHNASARQWRAALTAATALLSRFPDAHEAQTVQKRLATIKDNARLEEVRELRDRIRQLINQRRFPEATALAQEVIHRFPETAAAEELRGQLARLQDVARQQGAAPAESR